MSGLSPEQALRHAQSLWRGGQYDNALVAFEDLPISFPQRPALLGPVARAQAQLGLFDRCRRTLDSAAARGELPLDLAVLDALWGLPSDIDGSRCRFEALAARAPDFEWPRVALYQLAGGAAVPGQPFPRTPFERACAEATDWIRPRASGSIWVDLPVRVLEQALALAPKKGLVVECGVFFGRSITFIARRTGLAVHGFDSFEGLPEPWLGDARGAYTTGGQLPEVPGNVTLHRGWFEDTLPGFAASHRETPIALLHIDCDLYSSTKTVLAAFDGLIDEKTVIVCDDFYGFPTWQDHEFRALDEFAAERNQSLEVVAAAPVAREVAVRLR